MYEPYEIDISKKFLKEILRRIDGGICLLGGWATYHIVNENFETATGRRYIGSRDIDIGFHIDKNWTTEELIKSELSIALHLLEQMRFRWISFRLVKEFDRDTGRELTSEESAKLPLYRIFQLFVDPIVDNIHSKFKEMFGFVPIDEPFLSFVFVDGLFAKAKLFQVEVMMPKPHLLLAMKLNSVIHRDKEYKRIKDIPDIYALLWFSDTRIPELKEDLFSIYSQEKARKTIMSFAENDVKTASNVIGITEEEIKRVLAELA